MPTTIYSSVFRASSKLSHLTLKNCIFNHVLLRNCTIINGILHNCILFDCEIRNSVVKRCQVIKKPLALRRFAPEIRALVFEYVIEGEVTVWQVGRIPGLLKAVFGDQVLYHEAIEAMYKKAFVPLTFLWSMMKPAQVHMVTKVSIDCDFPILMYGSRELLHHCKAIQEIHIPWLTDQKDLQPSTCRNAYAALWVERFGTVRSISIVYRRISPDWAISATSQTTLNRYNMRMDELRRSVGADVAMALRYQGSFSVRVLKTKNGNALRKVAA
ncbi:hypothetical protein V8E51_004795 [Hyaloscypha variabilis]